MAKKKITTLLSLLTLPISFNVLSYGKANVEQEFLVSNNEENAKTKNVSSALNKNEETKEVNAQISMDNKLQTKSVQETLHELVDKVLEDLKNPIDFSKSFLFKREILSYDIIKNEFFNVLNTQIKQNDKHISIKLVNKNQKITNNCEIKVKVIGKMNNEKVKKITLVIPIKLISFQQYVNNLKKEIHITFDDGFFAYNPIYSKRGIWVFKSSQ